MSDNDSYELIEIPIETPKIVKVRKQRPRMTRREYNQRYVTKHKEEISSQKKDYYKRNKYIILEKRKKKKLCD